MYVQHSSNTILIGCPSNAPSLDFWGLTQPKQNIWITNHQQLELWWLWSGMLFHKSTSRSEHDQQMLSPRSNQCCRCESAWTRSRSASRSTRTLPRPPRRISWLDLIISWLDLIIIWYLEECLHRPHASKELHRTTFLGVCIGLLNSKTYPYPWPANASWSRRLKSERPERYIPGIRSNVCAEAICAQCGYQHATLVPARVGVHELGPKRSIYVRDMYLRGI